MLARHPAREKAGRMPKLLAIESSCDETAVAILAGDPSAPPRILASEISSQVALHQAYGGVVPELASRNHSMHLRALIERALDQAGRSLHDLDAFAATTGPGLASSLLVGSTAAKALALATGKPFIAVNHLEGHLFSPFIDQGTIPPHLALIVSGGHTLLLAVSGANHYQLLGRTLDDAAGEAFDKVAKMLGLPYPGGPAIERTALTGRPEAFHFPRSMLQDRGHDFSFSGLKTAVLYTLKDLDPEHGAAHESQLGDLCAAFQQAVVDVLVTKTLRAAAATDHQVIAVSGGVSMNQALRAQLDHAASAAGRTVHFAKPSLCTDNAAMIASAALQRHLAGQHTSLDAEIDPNLALTEPTSSLRHS